MKIVVTGANGQLGSDVAQVLQQRGHTVVPTDFPQVDIRDMQQTAAFFTEHIPDAVLHCAAYTQVEKAQEEPELCNAVNHAGSEHIAICCEHLGAKLVYISTDYVFDGSGDTPKEVNDPTGPLQIYGKTKLCGEEKVQALCSRSFVVRTSWLYGQNGANFVKTILQRAQKGEGLTVVDDQIGSPTFTQDLARLLCDIVETERFGIYHATNEGFCSWAEFAQQVLCLSGSSAAVQRIPSADYPAKAPRPQNSRLSKRSLDEAGFMRLPAWQDALARFLQFNLQSAK